MVVITETGAGKAKVRELLCVHAYVETDISRKYDAMSSQVC